MFCSQEVQTGSASPKNTAEILARLEACRQELASRKLNGKPAAELAFYGGTFTALPEDAWDACLAFVREARAGGLISGFRCSTRPDSLAPKRLDALKRAGCILLELGIQSFNDVALDAVQRGYSGRAAQDACRAATAAGLDFCVQLMPGMPEVDAAVFGADVALAIGLGAKAMRFYPCLVLKGTRLAQMFAEGLFRPWSLAYAVDALANGWLKAALAKVAVIRMGLAPQACLGEAIVAGPNHPALGGMVVSAALLLACGHLKSRLEEKLPGETPLELFVPRNLAGCIWGWRNGLKSRWLELGISQDNTVFWDRPVLRLVRA